LHQGLACITETISYTDKLIYSSLLIPCFAAVLLAPSIFADVWYSNESIEQNVKTRKKCWDFTYFSAFFITFAAYPAVSRNILSTFACAHLGADGTFLRADMRVNCPAPGDFAFTWAAVFTCLVPAGVPLVLLAMLVLHGVPCLAKKKRQFSLLQGLLQTFGRQLSESAVEDLFKILITVDVKDRVTPLPPHDWLRLAADQSKAQGFVQDPEKDAEQRRALDAVLYLTYPFGSATMTFEQVLCSVDAHRQTLRYMPKSIFEIPEDDSVLFVLLAFAIRTVGEYARGTADRSMSLFSLLRKAHKKVSMYVCLHVYACMRANLGCISKVLNMCYDEAYTVNTCMHAHYGFR
jgi:hypothetical protein